MLPRRVLDTEENENGSCFVTSVGSYYMYTLLNVIPLPMISINEHLLSPRTRASVENRSPQDSSSSSSWSPQLFFKTQAYGVRPLKHQQCRKWIPKLPYVVISYQVVREQDGEISGSSSGQFTFHKNYRIN